MGDGTDGRDDTILAIIGAAVMAGAYSTLAAELPEARPGLLKMARKHHERVTALCGEVLAGAALRAAPHQ